MTDKFYFLDQYGNYVESKKGFPTHINEFGDPCWLDEGGGMIDQRGIPMMGRHASPITQSVLDGMKKSLDPRHFTGCPE